MSRSRSPRRANGERRSAWRNTRLWLRGAIALATWGATYAILLGYNLFPGRISLRVGELSPVEVRAPRTAQYIDAEETRALRREAERQVMLQYTRQPFALEDAEKRFDQALEAASTARSPRRPEAQLRLPAGISAESLAWAAQASPRQREALRARGVRIIRTVMSREIREGTPDVRAAGEQAAALARQESGPNAASDDLLAALVRHAVGSTHRYDPEATAAARAEAGRRVADVVRTISAGYRIIGTGERVTSRHLAMLRAVGLIGPLADYRRRVSLALITGLLVLLVGAQAQLWAKHVYQSLKLLLLLSLLLVGSLFAANLLLALPLPSVWMVIVPATALIGAVLLTERVGLLLAITLALLAGLTANSSLLVTLACLGSALVALSQVSHLWPVSRLRWIVGTLAGANVVLLVALALGQGQPVAGMVKPVLIAGLLYGPVSVALALGGIFLLQRPFGITTHLSLLELSNPQHPLLRRLQAEAPGTYYASVIVANLADTAAEAVEADPLLARVGALYHDLGKLMRPTFFVENQALLGADNAHDHLSSSLSGLIIRSHVKDGVELAERERLPREVIDIIAQHHGTTLVTYFYHRALTSERPESVSEEQFRYPGPLPRRKEAALVMLADTIQAATKAVPEPTPQRVQQLVTDIIRERVVDGQLAESDLTFRDLAVVESTMSRLLTALVCHARVEYPELTAAGSGA
jgi:putative nucleotidyltransferase with HDIG domain